MTPQRMLELMSVDKKARDGRVRFVVLERLGAAILRGDVPATAIDASLSFLAA
jgi:3-dehydroquinate synthetase